MSDQIFFDTFVCIDHGSLNEAFVTNNSFSFSSDSFGDCMEQGSVLESSSKPLYTLDDQSWSAVNGDNIKSHGGFASKDSSSPSNVYPSAIYNNDKSCISIVKSSGSF